MTGAEFLLEVNDVLRGTDDDAPAFGDDEAVYWLRILNRKKRELYSDTTKLWSNTWSIQSLGTVTVSASPSYNTAATLLAPSDNVYVITTEGHKVEYDLIKPQERTTLRQVYLAGMNPESLKFTNPIITGENIVGGTLYLPGYYMPADVDAEDDVLPFTHSDWAVYAVASEVAENDITYEDKAENLNAKATYHFGLMTKRNRHGSYKNPRKTPTVVNRIRGVR